MLFKNYLILKIYHFLQMNKMSEYEDRIINK